MRQPAEGMLMEVGRSRGLIALRSTTVCMHCVEVVSDSDLDASYTNLMNDSARMHDGCRATGPSW